MDTSDNPRITLTDGEPKPAYGEWIRVICNCDLPKLEEVNSRKAGTGSVWQCGICKKQYELQLPSQTRNGLGMMVRVAPHWTQVQQPTKKKKDKS